MRVPIRLGSAAVAAAAAVGLAAAPTFASTAAPAFGYGGAGHVVFVQTDNTAGNQVVAYHRAADGVLSPAGAYATNGLGGILAGSVAGCPQCTEYLAQMRETISLTGRLAPEDLTPQMQDEFVDLYRRWRSEQQ
ncbi:MAG TPA: hypothetical protein VG123_16690 [Streptosporangiaceae bacterium]|nr:hypothetical protein [Streptosporangiaceae bacterium]